MKQQIILILLLCLSIQSYSQSNEETLPTYSPKESLSLRTNLVTWAMLIPNVGVEYKSSDHVGLILEGGWARWNINTQNKYWRMWNVTPQARYYFGETKYNYLGLQYTMGEYNFTGSQAKYMGGGLTLGHQFYAGKNLMVDLGLSLGYLYLYDKEKYTRRNGVDYRDGSKSSNGYWGPTGATISFVWKIN